MQGIWILTTFLYFLQQASPVERSEFPLERCNYWLCHGNVAWVETNSTAVQRRSIGWRMEVTEVISRDLVVAAVLKRHPRELIWVDPTREPSTYVIVQVNLRQHYLLEAERAQAALKLLKEPSDLLS